MSGIYGLSLHASSASAGLQQSLASRLLASLDCNGSPEYSLTWNEVAMPSREPICVLRASARPTSGSGFTGWVSPTAQDGSRGGLPPRAHDTGVPLSQQVALTGWRSPNSKRTAGGEYSDPEKALARLKSGHQVDLRDQVQLSGWPSPNTPNGGRSPNGGVTTTGMTPDGIKRQVDLQHVARSAEVGLISSLSPAAMEKRGVLSPAHSRWLMGFPNEWDSCGVMAMRSYRKSRRRS